MNIAHFQEAIHVGELVTLRASINYTGRTSMEVGIRVDAENIRSGERRHTNSCYFTMVAIDDDGRPALAPSDATRTGRFDAPQLPRTLRRDFAERLDAVAATGRDVDL
jgi:acyl-CoA hydrolase